MEIDQEQERRRNNKYKSQEEKAATLPKKGFTEESWIKAQETRRRNNTCGNYLQKGHYAKDCMNERVEALRGKLMINQELKEVIFDTGAAVNVITSETMDEMGLSIEESSTIRCVMINEDKLAFRGTTTIYIQFWDKEIPIKMEVIDSEKGEIIFGNGVLKMFNANTYMPIFGIS
ncbi:hypothetical protein C1646_776398 [Rhizophagus diaphanus]|nr:hypothetical protein C1646_776398 [Rhizophagus diaphanus] [Rhizophagus sp. MUCL 43196]